MLNRHHFGFQALWLILLLMSPLAHAGTDCAAVTEIPSTECEILIELYNNTGGTNWRHNAGWNVTDMPCSWYGVECSGGHISRLSLSSNQLTGSIPTELGNLSNLKELWLYGNELTGSIPRELGNLSVLIDLGLSLNDLTGSIPTELGNLTNLNFLYLSSNQLTGSIPSELGKLTNLSEIYLSDNQLTGSIPTELGKLTDLWALYLSSNELTGSIPSELGKLTNLSEIYLSSNQLTGSIPSELGNLNDLEELYLSDNQLAGSIPSQLGNLSNLWELWLDNNELCGEIPVELENLSSLDFLRLDNNHLTASDPELVAWLDEHNPGWDTTQTACPIATLQFSSTTYNVIETDRQATIIVTRVGGNNGAISANYATTSDGTATAGNDYTQTTGTLSWADGDWAEKTFTIAITNDGHFEGSETFTIILTDSGESLDNATITIYDDYATFVILTDFTATATEFDNAEFNLWRATGEGWKHGDYSTVIRVTEQVIVAQSNSGVYSYRANPIGYAPTRTHHGSCRSNPLWLPFFCACIKGLPLQKTMY
ncbi:MAG: leucine-rich repeat domain-containing protein [Pseudomonadota bacterium]